MATTILDVAREAGVSKSTVSLVINGKSTVKLETRYRVLEAIEKLGYVPNVNARNLTSSKTGIFGILMIVENQGYSSHDFDSETEIFSYDISVGISQGLSSSDYGILNERFCAKEGSHDLPNLVQQKRVDGVFIMGGLFRSGFVPQLKKQNLPIVVVGRQYPEVDCIWPDIEQAAFLAATHLFETGHRRVAFINCPTIFPSNSGRYQGFRRAGTHWGVDINPRWQIDAMHNTGEAGYYAFRELWESGARPDSVLAANDTIALGIMRYLYEQNVRIPEDISIIGYEDSILAGYSVPPLTTIHIDKFQMGEEVAGIMLNRIERPRSQYVSLRVQPTLVARGTVKDRR